MKTCSLNGPYMADIIFIALIETLYFKGRIQQKPSRVRGPRTSLKRSDTRMNIDWRTTKDQDYNMAGNGLHPPQPTEPIGHMIQYSQLRLLLYYFNYRFWEYKFHLSPFVQKVPKIEFGHHFY